MIRPSAPGWPWSGAFNLPDREAYFGLRLRNRSVCAAVCSILTQDAIFVLWQRVGLSHLVFLEHCLCEVTHTLCL